MRIDFVYITLTNLFTAVNYYRGSPTAERERAKLMPLSEAAVKARTFGAKVTERPFVSTACREAEFNSMLGLPCAAVRGSVGWR